MADSATTTLAGYAVQLTGFIPVSKKDLRKQADIPLLLLDVQEGRRPASDIIPLLRQLDIRQQYVNKRFTPEEIKLMDEADHPET